MADFDSEDCLARYRALVARYPERFANPSGEIYEILLETDAIAHAQAEAKTWREREGLPVGDLRVGVLADDPYLISLRDAVRFADGRYGLYNRLMVPSGAAVLPLKKGAVVLLNRFRHGTRRWHLEIPRGSFSNSGTRAEEAAREVREEIGAEVTGLQDLGLLHATTGCLDEEHQLYIGQVGALGAPDKHEAVKAIEVLPVPEVERLIGDGTITDGPTLAAWARARVRGLL